MGVQERNRYENKAKRSDAKRVRVLQAPAARPRQELLPSETPWGIGDCKLGLSESRVEDEMGKDGMEFRVYFGFIARHAFT